MENDPGIEKWKRIQTQNNQLIIQLLIYLLIYSVSHFLDVYFCSLTKSPPSVTKRRKATACSLLSMQR